MGPGNGQTLFQITNKNIQVEHIVLVADKL
jgi:hypothetical protein